MAHQGKFLRPKESKNALYNTLKSHTKHAHTVRGRPALKNVQRFRNGSVRELSESLPRIILVSKLSINIDLNKHLYYMASSSSGQDEPNPALWLVTRAGKMERYCLLGTARFVPAITFRRSPSGCTKVFFRKIFSVTVKRFFCDFSVGMELESEKTKTRYHFAHNWLSFQCSKIKKYEDHFSVLFMPYNWISVHKNAKRERGQYLAILTSRLVNNIYILISSS